MSDYFDSYNRMVRDMLAKSADVDGTMHAAVGGEFQAMGELECDLLIAAGLEPEHYVIDIGCGSGRLALPLSRYLTGRYLGTDVVQELLSYATSAVGRRDWRFELVKGLAVPERDKRADFVCLFSVITHLTHEETFVLLSEAERVLKPGGRMVVTFLDFAVPSHWTVFINSVRNMGTPGPLAVFTGRDAIRAWANNLGLSIEKMDDGDMPHIPLRQDVVWDNGTVMSGLGNLGQSVAILRKPD